MRTIEPRIRSFIKDNHLYVLRSRKTGKALNVSYTREGLKWTTSNYGKLLFYTNARIERHKNRLEIVGDLTPSDAVYIEEFIPLDNKNLKVQISEIQWTDKALRLLYNNESKILDDEEANRLVYQTA